MIPVAWVLRYFISRMRDLKNKNFTLLLGLVVILFAGMLLYVLEAGTQTQSFQISLITLMGFSLGYLAIHRIRFTESKNREVNLLKKALDLTNESVFMFDQKTLSFLYVNQRTLEQVGYTQKELFNMKPFEIGPEYEEMEFRKLLAQAEKSQAKTTRFETTHQHKEGVLLPVEITLHFIEQEYEQPLFLAIVRNIAHERGQRPVTDTGESSVDRTGDVLAKLADKEETAKVSIDSQKQDWKGFKVLVVDDDESILDQVKLYFDELGVKNYQFESSATSAMSNMVQQQQSYDLVMTDLNMPKVDGITFMRFLSKVDFNGVLMIISGEDDRLLNSVVKLANAQRLNIVGVLHKPFNLDEMRQMLDQVNVVTDEADNVSGDQTLTEDEIKEGLSRGRLELYFQPKVSVCNMSVSSFEVLSRWRGEAGEVLGPHLFIPVAEQSELINDLTDQVFIKTVQQVADWREQGLICSVAVNFSMISLERISLPDTLSAICSDHDVSPEYITIEVTETSIMNQEAIALDVITRLHLKGFKLSIDDFGTGYSSFEQLNKLPFSEIKIDRAFVNGAAGSFSSRAILESSIDIGKKMGISIVSEGLENEQDFELLKKLGTDYVQGYLFSRPIPAALVLQWVEVWNRSTG